MSIENNLKNIFDSQIEENHTTAKKLIKIYDEETDDGRNLIDRLFIIISKNGFYFYKDLFEKID